MVKFNVVKTALLHEEITFMSTQNFVFSHSIPRDLHCGYPIPQTSIVSGFNIVQTRWHQANKAPIVLFISRAGTLGDEDRFYET